MKIRWRRNNPSMQDCEVGDEKRNELFRLSREIDFKVGKAHSGVRQDFQYKIDALHEVLKNQAARLLALEEK